MRSLGHGRWRVPTQAERPPIVAAHHLPGGPSTRQGPVRQRAPWRIHWRETPSQGGYAVNLVERLKGILLSPKTEWPKIAAEPMTTQGIYTGWVMILAAIGPLVVLLTTRSIGMAIGQYLMMLAMTAIMAFIVDALAPQFGGSKDFVAALKLSAFSYTAAFVGAIFGLLGVLGGFLSLAAAVYAWYTFYLGAPVLRKCAPEKAVTYTIIVVIAGIVIGIVLGMAMAGAGLGPKLAMPG
jgi:hypothetical protein